jgi:hypothetical protein
MYSPCSTLCLPACSACLPLQFPYYTFVDRSKMYSIGSLFYAIYFFVSFPMFMRLDEQATGRRWSLREVSATSALHTNIVNAVLKQHSYSQLLTVYV